MSEAPASNEARETRTLVDFETFGTLLPRARRRPTVSMSPLHLMSRIYVFTRSLRAPFRVRRRGTAPIRFGSCPDRASAERLSPSQSAT